MSRRDSRSTSNELMPTLARHYIAAQQEFYNYRTYVHKKRYPLFRKQEKRCHDEGVSPRDYAYRISKELSWFVRGKGYDYVPINVFCGSWAFKRFQDQIGNFQTQQATNAQDERAKLIHSEMLVAEYFISNDCTYKEAADTLRPLLAPEWLQLHFSGAKAEVEYDVIRLLQQKHGLPHIRTYMQLKREWCNKNRTHENSERNS